MKERKIYLTPEEINYLVKGTIHWEDVKGRVDATPRKPIESRGHKGLEEPILPRKKEDVQPPFAEENNVYWKLAGVLPRSEQDVREPFLEGNNVYWILAGVGMITLGTWIYFVFAI